MSSRMKVQLLIAPAGKTESDPECRSDSSFLLDSFETLYQNLPQDMDAYYSKEEQANYGVVGIKIALSPSGKNIDLSRKQPSGNRGLFVFHVKQSFISG